MKLKIEKSLIFLFLLCGVIKVEAYKLVTRDFETIATTVPAHGHAKIQMRSYRIKEDGWLIEARPMIINGPGYLLHHGIAVLVPGETSFCGEHFPVTMFWGSGREHETLFLPNGYNLPDDAYGIRVKKGQRVAFFDGAVMLYNPDDVDYHNVKFRITTTFYVPEKGDPPLKDLKVLPLFFTQRPNISALQFCPQFREQVSAYRKKWAKLHPEEVQVGLYESTELGHHHGKRKEEADAETGTRGHHSVTFWIPPNTTKVDRWMLPLEIGSDMEVYGIIGHVHDFADHLKLFKNGQEIYSAPILKDKDGRVTAIPLVLRPGISFKKGDQLMMEAQYTNPHDVPVDAMAIIALLVHQKGKGELVRVSEKLELPPLKEAKKAN